VLFRSDVRADERLVEMDFELGETGQFTWTETPADVVSRMSAAVDAMAEAHPGQRVVAIGHAGAIVNYLSHVLQLEPGQLRLLPYYTSISVVRVLGDRRMVGALADTSHLE
jgi:broad specificity phosphatase PhoE